MLNLHACPSTPWVNDFEGFHMLLLTTIKAFEIDIGVSPIVNPRHNYNTQIYT
jgi:hypothetical protein